MSKITRYKRRINRTFISSLLVATLILIIFLPAITDSLFDVSVDYYIVSINGKTVGTANSIETAGHAMAQARLKYSREFSDVILINPHITVEKGVAGFAERMSVDELSKEIYSTLFENVVTVSKQEAYTVSVGDYAVNLASINDVAKLMDRLKERYDITGQFTTVLDPDVNSDGEYSVTFSKATEEKSAEQIVADMFNGSSTGSTGSNSDSGVIELYFKDTVKVKKNEVDSSDIKSVADAYDDMSQKEDITEVYYVQNQDTLDSIAKKYQTTTVAIREQNSYIDDDLVVVPGNVLNISYSKPMISVITVRNMSFEEDYMDLEYWDDKTSDYGSDLVIDGGKEGHRSVTARMIYEDGVQTDREVLSQVVSEQCTPRVISVGIRISDGEYVRPINGGTLFHGYGEILEKNRFNQGVDWQIDAGTKVVSASDGKVTKAGWFGDSGLMIEVTTDDGTIFRYGYLSEINVKVNDTVNAGREIGKTGSTGYTDTDTLHFEILKEGSAQNPLGLVPKN